MPRSATLALLAVLALVALPSSATAAGSGSNAGARECVQSTAPGKARGTCVSEVARNIAPAGPALTVASNGYYTQTIDGVVYTDKLFSVAGTGFNPDLYTEIYAFNTDGGYQGSDGGQLIAADGTLTRNLVVYCEAGQPLRFEVIQYNVDASTASSVSAPITCHA